MLKFTSLALYNSTCEQQKLVHIGPKIHGFLPFLFIPNYPPSSQGKIEDFLELGKEPVTGGQLSYPPGKD
jgi:hypothetical protein